MLILNITQNLLLMCLIRPLLLTPSPCKNLFSFFSNNSRVEFCRSCANKVAHTLDKMVLFSSSPHVYQDNPSYISDFITNEKLSYKKI